MTLVTSISAKQHRRPAPIQRSTQLYKGASGDPIRKAGYTNYFGDAAPQLRDTKSILSLKGLAANWRGNLNKAAQAIGIPPDSNNELALFVPQDLRRVWSAITATQDWVVASPLLPTVPAFSTQIEWVVETADGGRRLQTHFMGESGPLPGNNLAKARTGTANVKLFADRRTLTTVAQVVGMIGGINPGGPPMVSRNGLEKTTAAMVREQITEYERMTLFGDSDVDPLEFDGLIKQIKDNGTVGLNVHDMGGTALTFERFLTDVARLVAEPTFGKIEFFLLTANTYAALQIQASDTKRWVQGAAEVVKVGAGWTFNPAKMELIGPMNNVITFKVAPYLAPPTVFPTANVNTPAVTMTYGNDVTSVVAAPAGTAFPGGTYKVGIVGAFGGGSSAGFWTPNVSVTSGDHITVTMDDAGVAFTDSENPLRWYEIWLTDDTGSTATAEYYGRFPIHNGGGGNTVMVIDYSAIPGTDHAIGLQINGQGGPGVFRAELLGSTRFPIPYQGLGTDMVLCNITTPVVAHYEQQLLYYNIDNGLAVS